MWVWGVGVRYGPTTDSVSDEVSTSHSLFLSPLLTKFNPSRRTVSTISDGQKSLGCNLMSFIYVQISSEVAED